jgi:hypothetical protein
MSSSCFLLSLPLCSSTYKVLLNGFNSRRPTTPPPLNALPVPSRLPRPGRFPVERRCSESKTNPVLDGIYLIRSSFPSRGETCTSYRWERKSRFIVIIVMICSIIYPRSYILHISSWLLGCMRPHNKVRSIPTKFRDIAMQPSRVHRSCCTPH